MSIAKQERIKQIKIASFVGLIGNLFLSLIKIIGGIFSNSMALIGDGIDSLSDVSISIVTLFTAKLVAKPPDKRYPYGQGRAETVATKVLSFIIFFAGFQLLISTIASFFTKELAQMPKVIAIYIAVLSIFGKLILAFVHFKIGKNIKSEMLIANGKNMQNDILISFSVVLGLIFTLYFKMPILDKVTAIIVSLWIIKTAFKIFLETSNELMDGVKNLKIYDKIFKLANAVEGVHNVHRTRIRKMSNLYLIDLDIEVEPTITVKEGHHIAVLVERNIKKNIADIYDIMVHIEPLGNVEIDESYGVSFK